MDRHWEEERDRQQEELERDRQRVWEMDRQLEEKRDSNRRRRGTDSERYGERRRQRAAYSVGMPYRRNSAVNSTSESWNVRSIYTPSTRGRGSGTDPYR